MTRLKIWLGIIMPVCLIMVLPGCSALGFWLSGCGGEDADLVVLNDSQAVVGSITLDYGAQTEHVSNAAGYALLERGESFGLALEEGTEQITVILFDPEERELARVRLPFEGERVYLTLGADRALRWSTQWEET